MAIVLGVGWDKSELCKRPQLRSWTAEGGRRRGTGELEAHAWRAAAAAKLHQSCLILCDPTDGSPPGSTVPGILQARTLAFSAHEGQRQAKVTTACGEEEGRNVAVKKLGYGYEGERLGGDTWREMVLKTQVRNKEPRNLLSYKMA